MIHYNIPDHIKKQLIKYSVIFTYYLICPLLKYIFMNNVFKDSL